ncbi:MAG: hypothetical protein OJF55_001889 [Rhodanobacteraceae bacterium]|jgi:SAM-dependent methyltransferase|nr:MAG: hypothetical protein OJF55_001889 [Rhodanobacteraceae bacterium]
MMWCHACSTAFDTRECPHCGWGPRDVNGLRCFAMENARAGHGYDPAYYADLARLETRHFWFRARNRLIVHAMRKYFPRARSFLEIGCGTGVVLQAVHAAMPGLAASGSELFVEGIHFARERLPGLTLMQMDATRIPFADEYDVIGAFDVLEHVDEDLRVLGEIHRALHPGGGVLLTVPQHPWLWSHQDELAHHVRRYRRGELEEKLRRTGFDILHSTSFVTLLLPLLLMSRRVIQRKGDDPFHELRIGGLANVTLGAILKFEFQSLRMGLRLPIGGSRLIVAAKRAS